MLSAMMWLRTPVTGVVLTVGVPDRAIETAESSDGTTSETARPTSGRNMRPYLRRKERAQPLTREIRIDAPIYGGVRRTFQGSPRTLVTERARPGEPQGLRVLLQALEVRLAHLRDLRRDHDLT